MGGSAAAPSPYQQVTTTEEMPKWKRELLGLTPNAPEYSPFKALSRQAGTQAKIIEGMTSRPTWSSMYAAYGLPQGSDLTPYIQAARQGTTAPLTPIPKSPGVGETPEFAPPTEVRKLQSISSKPGAKTMGELFSGLSEEKGSYAGGGLMSLAKPRGYAKGASIAPKIPKNASADDKLSAIQSAVENGYKPKPADVKFMQTMADTQGVREALGDTPYNVNPKTGAITPIARGSSQTSADYTSYLNKLSGAGVGIDKKIMKQYGAQTSAQQANARDQAPGGGIPLSQALNQEVPFYDPTGRAYNTAIALQQKKASGQTLTKEEEATLANSGAMLDPYGGITNPVYRQALDQLRASSQAPETIGQGAGIMSSAAGRLMDQAGYTPQQVAADRVSGSSMQGREARAAAMNAATLDRSAVRDINAIMADVERYQAAGMQAPPALQAEAYQAAQMQGAQLEGPKSWTDAGTAQKYMSPYQQAVTNQELYEANRQAQMRENQQRSQATQQKAFGGTRAALQESEGRRNLGYLLSDIQNKGSQQAYTQGMQQFSAEQGLGLQAGQSNLQAALTMQQQNQAATNAQRQMYVQQALDAAKTSYGGELTAAQANQVAQNAASQFNAGAQNLAYNNYVQQQLAAQQANQGMDWNVGQMNTMNQQAANQLNAQNQQQAELANQQYGLGGFQSNLNNAQFSQQANLANQQAALQAAIQNQQAGLTGQGLNLQALNQAGQLGQGLGALGNTTWGNQQNVAQLWGAAGQTTQNLAQQAANAKQQTGINWWGGMGNAYSPVVNMLNNAQGGTKVSNINQAPR